MDSHISTAASPFNRSVWRTLRFRLATWNAVVVLLTALLTLIGLRHGVHWALLHEMDQILAEDAREVALALSEIPGLEVGDLKDELGRKARGHQQHGWFVELLDGENRLVWGSADVPAVPLVAETVGEEQPVSIDNYRFVQIPVEGAPNGIRSIGVGAKLDLLQRDLQQIDRLVMLTAVLTALIAPLCGYWLAGRATRTLGAIIATAGRLRPTHMNERLPLSGTGDELDRLAETVNRLLDRIAAYLDEKREFLANAAHELRTPLAAIRSSVEVALNSDRSREEYEELLEDIIEQAVSLETLVNQLLLLSETDADRTLLQGEPVSLRDVVVKSIEMFRGVAESRGIELHIGALEAGKVHGNRHLLRQVVNNLIDNAVKYTPSGGKIEVDLTRDDKSSMRLAVKDTGIGISPEDLPHVYERFFRADRSRTRMKETQGTGLGLSICHAVVTAHHGTITCDSVAGEGTTASVALPIWADSESASIQSGRTQATLSAS